MKSWVLWFSWVGLCLSGTALGAEGVRIDPASSGPEYAQVRPFVIDKTEVTLGELIQFRQTNKFKLVPEYQHKFPSDLSLPANLVDWFEASAFCRSLGKRLPTRQEWELAAGVNRTYPWGEAPLDATRANLCDKNCKTPWSSWRISDGYERQAPVGSYPLGATPEGLLDMAGNLWEWTATKLDGSTLVYKEKDQDRDDFMAEVIIKGGSYGSNPEQLKNKEFAKSPTNFQASHVGFRCVGEAQ